MNTNPYKAILRNANAGYWDLDFSNSKFELSDVLKRIFEWHGDRVFGLYKTFHGNADARGLGLFMTKNQVEAMGGRISIESEISKGTTIKIVVP